MDSPAPGTSRAFEATAHAADQHEHGTPVHHSLLGLPAITPGDPLPCMRAGVQEEHAAVSREREELRGRTDALQVALMQGQGQNVLGLESSPQAILQKVSEPAGCLGWAGHRAGAPCF